MFTNIEDAKKFCAENGILMVDFMMIDLEGRWRHLTMPVERFTKSTLEDGVGFDGSNYGYAPVEHSDMVFVPDLSTAYVDAFEEIPTLAMIGDVYVIDMPKNRRFDQYPRNVAQRAEKYMKKLGIADEMRVGPEFEFFVFDHVSYSVEPNESRYRVNVEQAAWNSGVDDDENLGYKARVKGGYHIALPADRFSAFRSRVSLMMEKQGIAVKYHHHEVAGPGQLEIEVEMGSMLDMADKTMMTKYLIKNVAFAEGKTVTFMPKPIYAEAGSGLHIHMQLFKGGQPLFYDAKGYSQLSKTALHFIGGVLTHANALCAFTNPSTNSYKRLVPGYEAPVTIGFATANRSSVIRIPAYAKSPDKKRFELRCPDATCNPYYAFSAILMAGLDGIQKKIDPVKKGFGPYDYNLYNLSAEDQKKIQQLPRSLDDALDALGADFEFLTLDGVFPKKLIETWIEKRRAETLRFNQLPHPAEFELYYDL
ncbi:MAG: type I glutamate--ammonia ligase [Clostridiales bacterium]|nr:type I glutamate--ammonia ligase [Clostridiales bacterium]